LPICETDVVRPEHLDQALVLALVLLEALELVAAGAESAAGRVAQARDRALALAPGVDQFLAQHADDAVLAGVDLADAVAVLARRLDDAAGGRVDDRGDAARLGVQKVFLHGFSVPLVAVDSAARVTLTCRD